MNALLFLSVAIGISLLGTLIILWRNRRPTGIESGIDEFSREMRALAPESRRYPPGRGREDRAEG